MYPIWIWPPGPKSPSAHRRHVLPPLRPPGRIEPRCHVHPGCHMLIPALEMVGESTIYIYIHTHTCTHVNTDMHVTDDYTCVDMRKCIKTT